MDVGQASLAPQTVPLSPSLVLGLTLPSSCSHRNIQGWLALLLLPTAWPLALKEGHQLNLACWG